MLGGSRQYAGMEQGLTLMKLCLTRGHRSQCGLALGDLAWSNVENQARVGRAGGIPPIIAGMHAHPTHSGTQGGLALGNLASLCVPNRRIIAQAGGIPAILKSMKTNMQYPGVQVCFDSGRLMTSRSAQRQSCMLQIRDAPEHQD